MGMGSDNERRRYIVTPPLIDWAHTQNDPYIVVDGVEIMQMELQGALNLIGIYNPSNILLYYLSCVQARGNLPGIHLYQQINAIRLVSANWNRWACIFFNAYMVI